MRSFIEYLWKNKEWIFSGVGVVIVIALLKLCVRLLRRSSRRQASADLTICGEKLSDTEREILLECAARGELQILKSDGFGSWARAGKRAFIDQNDPAVQARYLEAFESLCGRGYFREEAADFYRLTGTGFQRARRIVDEKSRQAV